MSNHVFVTPNLIVELDEQQTRSVIQSYWPAFYLNIADFVGIADIEDSELEQLRQALSQLFDDQFVISAGQHAIRRREQMLGIQASSSESLDFRRRRILNRYQTKPPFTVRFLQQQLDLIVGAGMTLVAVDPQSFLLTVTTNIDNASVFNEVLHTINTVKPVNLIYQQNTALEGSIELDERISTRLIEWNYNLGGSWKVGAKPFASFGPEVPVI